MLRAMATDRNPEERAARWLAAWDGQGIHRTATAGDQAGALWLAAEAEALGAAAAFEEVALDRLDPVAAGLDIAGERRKRQSARRTARYTSSFELSPPAVLASRAIAPLLLACMVALFPGATPGR